MRETLRKADKLGMRCVQNQVVSTVCLPGRKLVGEEATKNSQTPSLVTDVYPCLWRGGRDFAA
jgi:hypothetical protein